MLRVEFDNVKKLQSFLHVGSLDYIDFILHGDELSLVMDSNEVFTMVVLRVAKSNNQTDTKFRVHRSLLSSLVQGDSLEITVNDSKVLVAFYNINGFLNYSCEFDLQAVAESSYFNKITLVKNLSDNGKVDSEDLEKLYRIAKYNHGLVNVDDKVASVLLQSGERIYHPVKTDLSFAFTSEAFERLRKCNLYFTSAEEYLVSSKDNFFVAVRKARVSRNSEYGLITSNRFGSKFIAEIDLGSLFSFLGRMKTNISALEIHVDRENCNVEIRDTVFTIPIKISGRRLADGAQMDVLMISTKMINSILNLLGSNVFTLKVKKNFIQFEIDNYVVVA